LFGSGSDSELSEDYPSDDQISNSLNRKMKEIDLGIGKRYITRTQRGFLNVHYEVRMLSLSLDYLSSKEQSASMCFPVF